MLLFAQKVKTEINHLVDFNENGSGKYNYIPFQE